MRNLNIVLQSLFFLLVYQNALSQTSKELLNNIKNNVVYLEIRSADEVKEGFGFITGERDDYLFAIVPSEIVYFPDAPEGQKLPLQITTFFYNDYSEKDCTVDEVDILNNIARLKIKKPEAFYWERACLPFKEENSDPVFAIGELSPGPSWEHSSLDTLEAVIIRSNYRDIVVSSRAQRLGATGAALLNDEGFLGLIILPEGFEQIARKASIIKDFMTSEGRMKYAYQLEVSAYALQKNKKFNPVKGPRMYFNLRAGNTGSVQDIDDSPNSIVEANGLGRTLGAEIGVRWPGNLIIGLEGRYYQGEERTSDSAFAFYEINSKGFSLAGNIGYEWVFRRWQIAPFFTLGTAFYSGDRKKNCLPEYSSECSDISESLDAVGLVYGIGLSSYFSLSQSVRLGGVFDFRFFNDLFVKDGIAFLFAAEYSFSLKKSN